MSTDMVDIVEENKQEILKIIRENIKREGIDELVDWLLKSDFFTAPASTKYHSNYMGGLAEHSLKVYDCLKAMNDNYPEFEISNESVAICGLFHDLCKVNFYKIGFRNVKNEATGIWEKKVVYEIDETFPIGHGEKSCIILQWFLKKLTIDELMAIRYHMGGFDPAAKGGDFSMTRAYEKCPLAPMLHLADTEATYLLETFSVR